jgi:hypothetical protein
VARASFNKASALLAATRLAHIAAQRYALKEHMATTARATRDAGFFVRINLFHRQSAEIRNFGGAGP